MTTDAVLEHQPRSQGGWVRALREQWDARSWKDPVRVATTANITRSGTQTIDGVAVALKDRVLVKNQNTASQNGIFVVRAGTWLRALDAKKPGHLRAGTKVAVQEGSTLAGTTWRLTTTGTIVLDTTSLTFAQDADAAGAAATAQAAAIAAAATDATTKANAALASALTADERRGLIPTGAVFTSHPRNTRLDALAALTTNRPFAMLVHIPSARTITSISMLTSTTAFASNTSFWFEVWDTSRLILAKTTEDTSGWSNGVTKTLNLTTPLPVAAGTDLYIAVTAVFTSTNGTLIGVNNGGGGVTALAPIIAGQSATTGATYANTNISDTRGAITSNPFQPWFMGA